MGNLVKLNEFYKNLWLEKEFKAHRLTYEMLPMQGTVMMYKNLT